MFDAEILHNTIVYGTCSYTIEQEDKINLVRRLFE